MRRRSSWLCSAAPLCLLVLVALGAPGCSGTKKKAGASIEERLAKAEKETSPEKKATALVKVARSQAAKNDWDGAKQTGGKALAALEGDGDAGIFAPRLVEVAALLAELGERKPAREALARAIQLSDGIQDGVRRTELLSEAGAIYGDKAKGTADSQGAKDTLKKATEVAGSVEERFRAQALAAVALGYTRSGQAEAASDVVDKLLEAAKTLEEPRAKAEALAAAAGVQHRTGKKESADKLLADAHASAKSVERAESRAYALLAVAQATEAGGDLKKTLSLLKEADKAADKVPEPTSQKKIVDKVRGTIADVEKRIKK